MNQKHMTPTQPDVILQQAKQQLAGILSTAINTIRQTKTSGAKRQPPIAPSRPYLALVDEDLTQIMDDTANSIEAVARNLESKGTNSISLAQIHALANAGVDAHDLSVIASLSGMTFSHQVSELRDRMETICSVPVPDLDGHVDWTAWTFESRESYLNVRPINCSGKPLATALDRVCQKISDQVWRHLPDTQYVAQRLISQSSPVTATKFTTTLMQCHNMASKIDPRLRKRTLITAGNTPTPNHPGQLVDETRPYPHPTTPSGIQQVLKASLGDGWHSMDMGELKDIDDLMHKMPDPNDVYLNQQGDVWYSKNSGSQQMLHDLTSEYAEDQSQWPPTEEGLNPDLNLTDGEQNLARIVSPDAPFATSYNQHQIAHGSPMTATAWLNRITTQQAEARVLGDPDPGKPKASCPSASECPTACAYVQRAGLLPHTLFPDGKYEDCRFHHFRIMHGSKPAFARSQLADKITETVLEESRSQWKQNVQKTMAEPSPQKGKRQQKTEKPVQTSLF